jgi:hypothetical protein
MKANRAVKAKLHTPEQFVFPMGEELWNPLASRLISRTTPDRRTPHSPVIEPIALSKAK